MWASMKACKGDVHAGDISLCMCVLAHLCVRCKCMLVHTYACVCAFGIMGLNGQQLFHWVCLLELERKTGKWIIHIHIKQKEV